MTLLQLDKLEKDISHEINTIARDKKIDRDAEKILLSNIYKRYRDIHKAYIDLIKHGDKDTKLEALKRALYLQWIGSFEPSHLTGVTTFFDTYENHESGLELQDFQFVYAYVDKLIESNQLDEELVDMLSYYSCWEYIFEFANFKDYKNLHNFVFNVADTNKFYPPLIKKRDLVNRGQMGDYFLGLRDRTENTSS